MGAIAAHARMTATRPATGSGGGTDLESLTKSCTLEELSQAMVDGDPEIEIEQFGRTPRHFAGGEWWLEHPGTIDDLWNAEKARDELIRISFGYWDYIKNHWPDRENARDYALVYVPHGDAKRETRRLVGDYILTQNDVQDAVVFPDRVAYGGWPIFEHTLPFDVQRVWDELAGSNPRIWTAERDRALWSELQGG